MGIDRLSATHNPFAATAGLPSVQFGRGVPPASRTPQLQGADGGLQSKSFQQAADNNCYAQQRLQPTSYSAPVFGGHSQVNDIAFA